MIFTKYGVRFRVSIYGGLDLWLDDRDDYRGRPLPGEWVRFGWDCYGIDPGEWTLELP